MMKKKKKSYEQDPLDLRYRRQRRLQRERRFKWFLTLIAILLIILIAVIFRRIALEHFDRSYKAPIENPTYWYEETGDGLFSTITPTITLTPTATVPSATPTPTATLTPTVTLTPTLTPTPKLRPRKTVEGNPADLLMQAESTLAALRAAAENENNEAETFSEIWFELLGGFSTFDAAEVYPNSDCSWMGIAGILIDTRGDPQIGYYVQIGLPDGTVEETLSGLFPGYGESGYELTLARPVQAFDQPVWIRILDQDRRPASEQIYFRPSSDCSKSLTMANFQRKR